MRTAHAIVTTFCTRNAIDMQDFWQWFCDGNHTQDEANVHDSRFLALLEDYLAERNANDNGGQKATATGTLIPSPLCLRILGPDGFAHLTQAITEAQRITEALGKTAVPFWTIQALAGCRLEARLHLVGPDNADAEAAPFDLTFTIPTTTTRTAILSPAESRLFIVNDTVCTARELIDQGRNDVPGLAVTRRWINRKELAWDFV